MTVWNYSYDALIYGINTANFDSFEPELKDVITKAAKDAAAFQINLNRQKDVSNVKIMTDKGMEIYTPTADELAKFKAIVAPVYDEFKPVVGADLLAKFQALSK
jgi:TRAP-type C4-dicarboxylate transport system substrate-binding protein